MSDVDEPVRIGPGELVAIESPPEIRRRQAFAKPGLWAGIATTQPGLVSGWHHHGDHDTIVYVLSGHVAIEFGEGGRRAVQVAAGDFLVIPRGLVHRESTPDRRALRERRDPSRRRRPADDRGRRTRDPELSRRSASTRSITSRQNERISLGLSMNCDGLMQTVVKPCSNCTGIDASAWSRSGNIVRRRRTCPRVPPTSSSSRISRPAAFMAERRRTEVLVARRSEGVEPTPVLDEASQETIVHRLAAEPQRRSLLSEGFRLE